MHIYREPFREHLYPASLPLVNWQVIRVYDTAPVQIYIVPTYFVIREKTACNLATFDHIEAFDHVYMIEDRSLQPVLQYKYVYRSNYVDR